MSQSFPHYDPASGELVPTTYYDVDEVGDMLHVSANTVRKRLRDGLWDGLHVLGARWYMNAEQIGDAVESMQTRPQLDDDPAPVKLGEPVDDTTIESIR